MSSTQQRPAGVTLAAAVLSLMTLFGAVCLLSAVFALFLTRNPIVPRIAAVRAGIAGFDLVLLLFLLWCAWTIVGLFRLRPAARLSMLAIGAIDLVVFAAFAGLMLLARANPMVAGMDAHPNPAIPFPIGALLLLFALLYALFAFVGLWWLVYFNLRPVRVAFSTPHAIDTPNSAG
ncbi:hypothetical protein [Silvibacterium dinghuense]|uniref:Uncharacterized protein n=1 Tax=Silvibacterium dinghuense TaxID=1560006 RepID=A0A4Q1SGK4_9BACT|nr:hypothetical protein [Silvibacterium dinghuense]RXS96646.1 hypothetical protein ESZ00_01480 [Silvibacterium dinghuense]GGG92507.1 hypothetical protein GCM10011586_04020 [Silvibacterium dinghuense]